MRQRFAQERAGKCVFQWRGHGGLPVCLHSCVQGGTEVHPSIDEFTDTVSRHLGMTRRCMNKGVPAKRLRR